MKTKLLGLFLVALGVFAFAGTSSASTANILQPAGATTFFESIRVGVAGQGGVTFFNGSVLNESGPFVIADDVRIDGGIFRTEIGPPNALKIYDTMNPGIDVTNDIGSSTLRWKGMYAKNGNFSEDVYSWGGLVTSARSEGTIKAGQSQKVVIPDGKPFQLLIGHKDQENEYRVANLTIMENNWYMSGVGTYLDGSNGPSGVIGGRCCEYTNQYMFTGTGGLANLPDLASVQCPNEKIGEHNIIIHATNSGDIYYRVIY